MVLFRKQSRHISPKDEKASRFHRCCRCLQQNLLFLLILLGVAAGIVLGICLRLYVPAFQQPDLHPRELQYLYFPAEIFLRVMMFMTLPLLVSSLVSGIGSLNMKNSGRIGLCVFFYYIVTTVIAVVEGFIYVCAIRPGANSESLNNTNTISGIVSTDTGSRTDSLMDMVRNIFPDNIITAAFRMHKTSISYKPIPGIGHNDSTLVEEFQSTNVDAMNILGITLMTIIFSIALSAIGSKGKPLFALFDIMFDTVMKIVNVLLWLYPVGIVFILATTVVQMQNPLGTLNKLALFIVTALAGLLTHLLIALPLIFFIAVRKNPYRHLIGCARALLTAFATSSSTLTLPVTMSCLKRLGYKDSVIHFMSPLGATINMDGTALYQAAAPVFIAMLNGMNPGPSQILILGLTAVVVSIGAPTVDSMIVFIIMFKSIGLPLNDIGLLLTFDWIMVRFRVLINVAGDCFGVAVVQALSTKRSEDNDIEEDTDDVEKSYLTKAAEQL